MVADFDLFSGFRINGRLAGGRINLIFRRHSFLGPGLEGMAVRREAPDITLTLVFFQQQLPDKAPGGFRILAGGGNADAAIDHEAAAVAAFRRETDEGHVAALVGGLHLHLAEVAEIAGTHQLLAAHQTAVFAFGRLPVVGFPVKLLGEGVGKIQNLNKIRAVEAAGAVLPVNEIVQVEGQALAENAVLGIRLAEDQRAGLQAVQGLQRFLQAPAGAVAGDRGLAGSGLDGEAVRYGVELAVNGHAVKQMGHQIVPAQLPVPVNQRPQVHQDPLSGILIHGNTAGAEHIRNVAGQDLRVQLLQGVFVGIHLCGSGHVPNGSAGNQLRIVPHHDAHIVMAAVKADDFGAQVPVQIHAGQGQLLLFRQRRRIHAVHQQQVAGAPVLGPDILNGSHTTVGQEGNIVLIQVLTVHVAIQPGEQLLSGFGALHIAIEVAVVTVVILVLPGAGIEIIAVAAERNRFAKVFGIRVDGPEVHAAVLVPFYKANLILAHLPQLSAAVFRRQRRQQSAGGIQQIAALPIADIEIALGVDADRAGIDVLPQIQGDGLQLLSIGRILHQIPVVLILHIVIPHILRLRIKILRQVVVVGAGFLKGPDCSIRGSQNILDFAVALQALWNLLGRIPLQL